jgi:hypothetical protein
MHSPPLSVPSAYTRALKHTLHYTLYYTKPHTQPTSIYICIYIWIHISPTSSVCALCSMLLSSSWRSPTLYRSRPYEFHRLMMLTEVFMLCHKEEGSLVSYDQSACERVYVRARRNSLETNHRGLRSKFDFRLRTLECLTV